jgi:nucleoside-diphosphate-sugar epimerase
MTVPLPAAITVRLCGVVVTGAAAGFIGGHLTRALAAAGHDVVAIGKAAQLLGRTATTGLDEGLTQQIAWHRGRRRG